jgi:hypothetical protein
MITYKDQETEYTVDVEFGDTIVYDETDTVSGKMLNVSGVTIYDDGSFNLLDDFDNGASYSVGEVPKKFDGSDVEMLFREYAERASGNCRHLKNGTCISLNCRACARNLMEFIYSDIKEGKATLKEEEPEKNPFLHCDERC